MTAERFTIRAAVYLVLKRDGQVLLSRRFQTGWQDGNYSMVAGHLDGNETVSSALVREAKEESGIDIKLENVRIVHTIHRHSSDLEYIDFFGEVAEWQGEPQILEADKCDDLRWFSLDNLPQNLLSYVRHALTCIENNINYSEYGWDCL